MELIILAATIIGLIAGIIAISDKSREFLFKKNRLKNIFIDEYNDWEDSGRTYISPRETFLKLSNLIKNNRFDDKQEAFCVALCTHYGDHVFNDLIKRNVKNAQAYSVLLNMIEKRGVRVGWRAEYALSTMDLKLVDHYFALMPYEYCNKDNVKKSIERIKSKRVHQFLGDKSKGKDAKLRNYAKEVLRQIKE